ncbi:ABC transporter substrate-binding protein [Cucumibacter marinus]|uniref:ABC transporter substrate-binding protein n=1 Tax=Cucumibacter marinus TaxID=1121252 RepID=UPI00048CB5F4|nr:extracellular solute-binding protein [Cucumibacter marinus]
MHNPTSSKKSAVALLAATAGLLTATAAFGQTEIDIVMPASGNGAAMETMTELYAKEHDDVVFNLRRLPPSASYPQTLIPLLQGGADIDIFFTTTGGSDLTSVHIMGPQGVIADLSDYALADEYSQDNPIFEILWDDGKLLSVPMPMTAAGLVYNNKLMNEYGLEVPTTFEELLEICDVATQHGKHALAVPGSSPEWMYGIVAAGPLLQESPNWNARHQAGEVTFATSEGWRKALERVATMRDRDCFPLGVQAINVPQLFAEVASENVFMAIGPSVMMGGAKTVDPDLDLRMAPFPGGDTEAENLAIGLIEDGVSIAADSANKEAAVAFLQWMIEPAQMDVFQQQSGGIPFHLVGEGRLPGDLTDLAGAFEEDRVGTAIYHNWPSARALEALIQLGSGLLGGSVTVDEMLAELDKAWEQG